MPSRSEMDRPATVLAALLGLALIAVTVPYFLSEGEGGRTFGLAWSEQSAATATAPVGPTGQQQEVSAIVRDQLVSNVTIELQACVDTAQAPLQGDAVLTFELLFENETAQDADGDDIEGQASCDDTGPFTFEVGGHPDRGSTTADSAEDAAMKAYAGADNRTGTYTLRFSWQRAPGSVPPLPIPVGQPAFTGTVSLDIESWRATANEDQEVPR